jgi:tryptophan-rich sensory protein
MGKNIKIDSKTVLKLVISLVICFFAAGVGSYFTIPEIKTWYTQIQKPSWNPPNYLFGPVWTTLYTLMGISLWLIWVKSEKAKMPILVFFIQLTLNAIWSIIFFNLHNISLALVDIILLFAAIIVTIVSFWKVSKIASILLIPYLLWVGFASCLNYAIYKLN